MVEKEADRKANGCLKALFIFIGIFVAIVILESFIPSRARLKVPPSASETMEYRLGGFFSFDSHHVLKARLPEADYQTYANRLGFTHFNASIHGSESSQFNASIGGVPDWWDEPSGMDHCYFSYTPGATAFKRIKWHDGWVYYSAIDW